LKTQDIQNVFDNDIFDETMGAEDVTGISDKEITRMWQEHMHDFVPEDMSTFVIGEG
jgi:hypothetical protein